MRRMQSAAKTEISQAYIIYIDGAYVLMANLVAETLLSPARVHVLREHWGLSPYRRRRDGHRAIYSGRNRGTRHAAIYGRIRCVGSVHVV